MNCEKAKEFLYDYIDDCLDDGLRQEIEKHIDGCTECRKEYELISVILNNCHNFEEEDLPQDFEHNLHERLMSEKHDAGRKRFNIRFSRINAVAAAALVLAVSMGVVFGSGILNSGKKSSTTEINGAADSAAPKMAAKAPSIDNKAVQFSINDESSVNGSVTFSEEQPAVQEFGAAAAPETGSNASRGMTYNKVTVNINQEQYDSFYNSIVSSIEEFSGYLQQKDPEVYILPVSNWDALYKRLNEEYEINDISIYSEDLTDQYKSLEDEIASIEGKEDAPLSDGGGTDIKNKLDEKRYELSEIDKKIRYVFIEINID